MADNGESGNDEMISQFLAVTGSSDPAKAVSYLEMSGNNVETAVGLYMDSFGGSGAGTASSSGAPGGAMLPGMEDDIRAPDATRTMRLMDNPMGGGMMFPPGLIPNDPSLQMMNAMMNEQLNQPTAFSSPTQGHTARPSARDTLNAAVAARGAAGMEGIFMDAEEDDDDMGETKEAEDEDENGRKEPVRLSDMFSPPIHLMHKAGGFMGARAMAKDTKRWLLVNIQRDEEFASHALNRDVWRDELVENLVRAGFIFWQEMDSHPDGRTYVERYKVQAFPHLAILDPRTGRSLWSKQGWTLENPVTPETFAQMAMDFCSRNSFDRPPQAPKAGSSKPVKRAMHEMSEAEQLEAALKESMKEGDSPMEEESDDEVVVMDPDDDEVEDTKPPAVVSMIDSLLAVSVGDEPPDGSRIQVKMPDGKRIVRKFALGDTVRVLYAFVAVRLISCRLLSASHSNVLQQNNEAASGGREFILMAGYPMRDLVLEMDSTMEDSKLKNEAITVRWK